MMKLSVKSMPIGSLGTAETPMRPQTVFTSGNSLSSTRSTSVSRPMVSESELPGRRKSWKAMSPSSRLGMNSAPMRLKSTAVAANTKRVRPMTAVLYLSERRRAGR